MPAIQQKRGTAARWTSLNPVLAAGEIGYETDTGLFKIGDGVTAWNSLSYAAAAGSHSHGNPTLALTNLSGTTDSNSAGLTLSLSAAAPGGGGLTNIRVSAGTTSNLLSALTFANSNGISFGLDASTITATVKTDYLTTAALSNHSHGNPTLNLTNLSGTTDSNSAGFTLSLSAGNYLTTAALSNHSHGNPTLNLTNLSGTTDSNSAGFTLSLSAGNYLTTAALSNHSHGASASNGSFAFQTINFSNANNVTFGTSAGSIVTASVAAPGGAAITQSIGLSTQTAGGSAGGTTGYVTGDDVLYHFVPGSNITMSQSINGSSGTLSIYGPAAGGGATISSYSPPWAFSGMATNSSLGQSTLYFQPFDLDQYLSASRINFYVSLSGALSAGNSTGSCTNRIGYAIYTKNSDSLSSLTSYSLILLSHTMNSNTQYIANHYVGLSDATSHSTAQTSISSSNASTYLATRVVGLRAVALPVNLTMTPGRYWLGFSVQTVTGNAMTNNISVAITSVGVQPYVGAWGTNSSATNASVRRQMQGWGTYSAQSAAWPATIAFTTDNIRAPVNQTLIHFGIVGSTYGTREI